MRVLSRDPLPEGLSVETGVLSHPTSLLVNYRPPGWYRKDAWFGRNRDSALGGWSLGVPEALGTSSGFVFGFPMPDGWRPVPGEPDTIEFETESRPLTDDWNRSVFAGPGHLVDAESLVRYRAQARVQHDLLEIELEITNLGDKPTSLFTHLCSRFHGRGLVWGWRERTYVQVDEEWIPVDRLLTGQGYPAGTHWFLDGPRPGAEFMEMYRPGSSNDPSTWILTSQYIVMQMQDARFTTIYGSPQAGMIFTRITQMRPRPWYTEHAYSGCTTGFSRSVSRLRRVTQWVKRQNKPYGWISTAR